MQHNIDVVEQDVTFWPTRYIDGQMDLFSVAAVQPLYQPCILRHIQTAMTSACRHVSDSRSRSGQQGALSSSAGCNDCSQAAAERQ